MKRLVLASLFALPSIGVAQTPSPPVPVPITPALCYPLGIRGEAVFDVNWLKRTDNGWYVFWFCKKSDGSYNSNYRFCRHGVCDQGTWWQTQLDVAMAADRAATLDADEAKLSTLISCKTEVANATANTAICTEVLTAVAVEYAKLPKPAPVPTPTPAPTPTPTPTPAPTPAPAPSPPAYVVARSFLSDGSRAVYPVVSGKISDTPVAGVKAMPGEPCDAVTTVVRLGLTYRSVKGRADWVAVCIPTP